MILRHRILLWVFGSFFALFLLIKDIAALDGLLVAGQGVMLGRDFANVWTGGTIAAAGETAALYPVDGYGAFQRALLGPLADHNYSYPPTTLFFAVPLSFLPYWAALLLWTAGTAALFVWAARPYLRNIPGFPVILAILTPAATMNIWAGHYGFLAGAVWLACFARMDAAPARAGLFAAALTIKPHLGVLMPLLMAAQRRWRTILVASAAAILLAAAAGAVFGFDLWRGYVVDGGAVQARVLSDGAGFYRLMMPTTYAAGHALGLPGVLIWAAQAITAAWALLLCARAARAGVPPQQLAFIGATATFLVLPYAFNYDMTVAALGFALLLHRAWGGLSPIDRTVLIAAFAAPQLVLPLTALHLPVVPLILLAALAIQVREAKRA